MFSNIHTVEKSLAEEELIERISWFITLRWIVVAGICTTSLFAFFALKIDLPLFAILLIAFCILLFNLACILYQKYIKCISYHQYLKSHQRFANIQISIDWIALVSLAHYTGGIESPMMFYFIFHVIIAATLLSGRECYLQTTFALLLMSCLSILEYSNTIHHFNIKELFPDPIYDNGHYLMSILFFFVTSLYVSGYLATTVAGDLRKREKEVVVLKNNISDAYNKLEAMDKEKSAFTHKVTHELRAPLSAVQSLLKSIEEGYAGEISEKARELIIRSENRTGFLLTLVNDLLDLVAGKTRRPRKGEKELIDINGPIKDTVNLLLEKAKAKDINIIFNASPKPANINIIPDDIKLILMNLIDNAIKYTKKGSTVRINNKIDDEIVKIEISDEGIGIHKDDVSKIFDEFYRASNARAIEFNGTGLGLSIVKSLIKRYDGAISVKSELEKGTTFTISFPKK